MSDLVVNECVVVNDVLNDVVSAVPVLIAVVTDAVLTLCVVVTAVILDVVVTDGLVVDVINDLVPAVLLTLVMVVDTTTCPTVNLRDTIALLPALFSVLKVTS